MGKNLEEKAVDKEDVGEGVNTILCWSFPAFEMPKPRIKPEMDTPAYTLAEGYKPYRPETTYTPFMIPP